MLKNIIFAFFFFCFFMLSWQTTTRANMEADSFLKPTSPEQIASLFYKLSKSEPDFTKWAKTTEKYKKAAVYDKDLTLHEQEMKAREIFYNVFPDELVQVQVTLSLDDYSNRHEAFFFLNLDEDTYFSYDAFDEKFALIVPDIVEYKKISMDKEIAHKLKRQSSRGGLAELLVEVYRAETKEPITINNTDRWALVGRIAEVRLWNEDKSKLYWSDFADWYEKENGLTELYHRQE